MIVETLDTCAATGGLISVADAQRRAAMWAQPVRRTEHVGLVDAVGRILTNPVTARVANPRFDQSAMDGYAVAAPTIPATGASLQVTGRAAAGSAPAQLVRGTAMRIFTGAPLPIGADAVVMQEHAERSGDCVQFHDTVRVGANVRIRGEDIREGELLLRPGQELDWRHVGLLASQGLSTVEVEARPRMAVLSTGNELHGSGDELGPGSIHDCNKPMLMTLARQAGFEVIDGGVVGDKPQALSERLLHLVDGSDLIVTSGGVSVGEEDHAAEALRQAGGSIEEFRMALKPGKSAAVGSIKHVTYLGLPGNPLAAVVVWLLLGQAILEALSGRHRPPLPASRLKLKSPFTRKPGLTEFIPARLVNSQEGEMVEIIGRSNSGRIRLLADADGLIECEANQGSMEVGAEVMFHKFQHMASTQSIRR